MGRPRKEVKEPDMDKLRRLIDDANTEANLLDASDSDFSGHRIAVRFGYLKRIIEEAAQEVGV